MILHIGGASTAAALITVVAIFFLIFAMSFAVGAVPEGQRRFSSTWFSAWFRASLPRLIVAAAFSALLFVGSALSGSDSTTSAETCDSPLAPLTGQSVSGLRLNAAISGLRDVAYAARDGDAPAAQSLFFNTDAHNVTHDVAGPLFSADRDLARSLCESVAEIKRQFATVTNTAAIAAESETSAGLLEEAGRVLGITE